MKIHSFLILAALLFQNTWAGDLKPYPVDWPRDVEPVINLSFLLAAPAGKDGVIKAAAGRLAYADGTRFRIWGINATGQATLPAKDNASVMAARLAALGLNCVRFHFLDRPAPMGLIDAKRNDTRALDPAQLDRLDFFIAALKHRGIYSDLNLNVGRTYKAGDGVADHELLGFAKALTYFDDQLLILQKEYARQLLTHLNPYTRSTYAQESAVALVEMVNENSLVESWFANRLLGQNTTRNPGTWTDIPASYAKVLTDRYNAWLRQHLTAEALARLRNESGATSGGDIPRLKPGDFSRASSERFHAEAQFYMEIEQTYFREMARYLREELKVKSLLVGSSDHNHSASGYPLLSACSTLEVMDGHVYWQHPRYLAAKGADRRTGFDIPNTPMVDDPWHSTVVQLSRSAVAGKPYIVSEVNHPFPNEYACEGIPILAAYAAFQDWDGIFWYTLAHNEVATLAPVIAGHFDLARDPVKVAQLAAGALLFLRGDIQPALQTINRSYSAEQVRESLRLPRSAGPYFTPGFPLSLPLQHAARIVSLNGAPTGSFEPAATSKDITSDTGELSWRHAAKSTGLVTVATDRSQALVGFCATNPPPLKNLTAAMNTPFCALTLHALDGKSISQASSLLLTTTAKVANTNMSWNTNRTSLLTWGAVPTLIEPVSGKIILNNILDARQVVAQPLDGAGRNLNPPISATHTASGWELALGESATTWYRISVKR